MLPSWHSRIELGNSVRQLVVWVCYVRAFTRPYYLRCEDVRMAAPPAKRTHNFAGRNTSLSFSSYTNSGYTMGTSPPFIGNAPTAVYNSSQWSLRRTILYIQEPVIMRPEGPLVRDRGASLRAYRCILYSMLYSNGTGGSWSSCWTVVLGPLCAGATGRYRLSSLGARRS